MVVGGGGCDGGVDQIMHNRDVSLLMCVCLHAWVGDCVRVFVCVGVWVGVWVGVCVGGWVGGWVCARVCVCVGGACVSDAWV